MNDEELKKKFPVETMLIINDKLKEIYSSLCEPDGISELDVILAVWSSVNLDLLLHNIDQPELHILNEMYKITVIQNEYIRNHLFKEEIE